MFDVSKLSKFLEESFPVVFLVAAIGLTFGATKVLQGAVLNAIGYIKFRWRVDYNVDPVQGSYIETDKGGLGQLVDLSYNNGILVKTEFSSKWVPFAVFSSTHAPLLRTDGIIDDFDDVAKKYRAKRKRIEQGS